MSQNSMIINICGTPEEGQILPNIGSDPNYIFVNDPNFNTLTLFDLEGNVINVNSWIECAHYVQGGWSTNNIILFNTDIIVFYFLMSIISIYFFYKIKRFWQK